MIEPATHETLSPTEAKERAIKRRQLGRKWSETRLRDYMESELIPGEHSGYRIVTVPKPGGSLRETYGPNETDLATAYMVKPGLEAACLNQIHEDDYGIGFGQGREVAIKRLKDVITDPKFSEGTILKTDIKQFYDTVPRILVDKLGVGPKQRAHIAAIYREFDKVAAQPGRGVPQGDPVAPIVAQMSLSSHVIRPIRRNYEGNPIMVYADDVCMVSRKKSTMHPMKRDLVNRLKEHGMNIVLAKTEAVRIRPGTRFEYMGVEFRISDQDVEIGIPVNKIQRMLRNLAEAKDPEHLKMKGSGWLQSLAMVTASGDRELAWRLVQSCWEEAGIQMHPPVPRKWEQTDAA